MGLSKPNIIRRTMSNNNKPLIKVCGMRDPENIRAVAQLPIDYMGFIFYPKSSRYVDMQHLCTGLMPDQADPNISEATKADNHNGIGRVGVFVDAMAQDIITRVVAFELDAVQLHGSETPTFIRNLRATIVPDIRPTLKVFKAMSISSADDFAHCTQYEGVVDMFVFDTKCTGYGGSGQQFDWLLLDSYHGTVPFLLSGGIGPDDAWRIKAFSHPLFAGVDLNSRFETEPAMKDVRLLEEFIGRLLNI